MTNEIRFVSAASFSLEALADIFTRSFEAYFYPGTTTAQILAARTRIEDLDMFRSVVMLDGNEPAGQAVLALRGDRAWCGGFGVLTAYRGRDLARPLIAALIDQAREAGAARFSLEVLTRNDKAIKVYTKAGLETRRDLQILEWRAENTPPQEQQQAQLSTVEPAELLANFNRLHPVSAAWQRDLPSLLVRGPMQGRALQGENGELRAYALVQASQENSARIDDLGAASVADAVTLLSALQAEYQRVFSVNEPTDSPITAAYEACGFVETDRQHEMWLSL